nr:MAG: putative peptidase [Barnaviridae sp.]
MEITLINLICIILVAAFGQKIVAAVAAHIAWTARLIHTGFLVPLVCLIGQLGSSIRVIFCSVVGGCYGVTIATFARFSRLFIKDPNIEYLENTVTPTEVVDGKLELIDGVFYQRVHLPASDILVRLEGASLFALLKQGERNPAESILQTSRPLIVDSLPKGQVALTDGVNVVGYGARVVIGKTEGLLTAAHVLKDLRKCTEAYMDIFKLTPDGRKCVYRMSREWELNFTSSKLDLAFVEVPSHAFASLGVSKATVSRLPALNVPISVTRRTPSGIVQSGGRILNASMHFKHSASTTYGTSGAPIFSNGKIIGVHIRGEITENIGVALDAFIAGRESDDRRSALDEADYIPNVEAEYVVRYGNAAPRTITTGSKTYRVSEWEANARKSGKILWADIEDDEDWELDGFTVHQESGLNNGSDDSEDFQIARPRGSSVGSTPLLQQAEPLFVVGPRDKHLETIPGKTFGKQVQDSSLALTSKNQVPYSLEKSAQLETGSAKVLGRKTECQKVWRPKSPSSQIGVGQKQALRQFAEVSTSTPRVLREELNLQKPSSPPSETRSVKLIQVSGTIPKRIREYINSLPIGTPKMGKKRMFLNSQETLYLRKLDTPEAKSSLAYSHPLNR